MVLLSLQGCRRVVRSAMSQSVMASYSPLSVRETTTTMVTSSRFASFSSVTLSSPHKNTNIHTTNNHINYSYSRRFYHPTTDSITLKESYENIIVDTHPDRKVALITLNRPKALNALNDALFQDLLHATKVLDRDDNVRCIVLTGSRKAFAAGADISEMQFKTYEECYGQDMFAEWQQVSNLKTPIIAAISGYCLGGGCELAMMCDIMICSQSAKFGQPEINLGVIPGAGGTQRLTRAIGKSKAMYMNLTGEFIDAQEAHSSGLVAKVFDDETLVDEAMKIATVIAGKGKLSVQAAKEAVNAADELSLQEGLRFERRMFHSLFATDDQKEGMGAFLEKRPAKFK